MTHKMSLRRNIDFYLFLQNHDLQFEYDESKANVTTLLLFPFLQKYNSPKFNHITNKFIKYFYIKILGAEEEYCSRNYYNSMLSSIIQLNYEYLPLQIITKFEEYRAQNKESDININLKNIQTNDYKIYFKNNICNENDFFDLVFTIKPDVKLNINEIAKMNVLQFLKTEYNDIFTHDFQTNDSTYREYIYQLAYHFATLHNVLNNYKMGIRNHVKINRTSQETKKRAIETDAHMEINQDNKRFKYNNEEEIQTNTKSINVYSNDYKTYPYHHNIAESPLPPKTSSLSRPPGSTGSYFNRLETNNYNSPKIPQIPFMSRH